MRYTLRNSSDVFHYWANQTQSEGRAGNVYFVGPKLYSYGAHFCIARILPSGIVVFTTRGYSPTTAKHVSQARSAASHRAMVFCNDPADDARQNMANARSAINSALHSSGKKGIRQTTRDRFKAEALRLAEGANAYLAALPDDERIGQFPIDTSDLESVRAELLAAEVAREKIRAEQETARRIELADSLARWRTGELLIATRLYEIPPALRLNTARTVVQTSHGAEIPVSDALALWPVILRVMRGSRDYTPGSQIGPYRLTQIRQDGSIRVGCHDIAHSEIQGIAAALGLLEGVAV